MNKAVKAYVGLTILSNIYSQVNDYAGGKGISQLIGRMLNGLETSLKTLILVPIAPFYLDKMSLVYKPKKLLEYKHGIYPIAYKYAKIDDGSIKGFYPFYEQKSNT